MLCRTLLEQIDVQTEGFAASKLPGTGVSPMGSYDDYYDNE